MIKEVEIKMVVETVIRPVGGADCRDWLVQRCFAFGLIRSSMSMASGADHKCEARAGMSGLYSSRAGC